MVGGDFYRSGISIVLGFLLGSSIAFTIRSVDLTLQLYKSNLLFTSHHPAFLLSPSNIHGFAALHRYP